MTSKRGKHRSLDCDLDRSVRWLESLSAVSKVVLKIPECCRHAYPPGHLKVQRDSPGGMIVKGFSGKGVIDLYVKVDPIEKLVEVKNLIRIRHDR